MELISKLFFEIRSATLPLSRRIESTPSITRAGGASAANEREAVKRITAIQPLIRTARVRAADGGKGRKPKVRFELTTPALRKRCSAIELLRHDGPHKSAGEFSRWAGRFQSRAGAGGALVVVGLNAAGLH